MGYRSDVRIMTSKKGFEELKKYTEKYLKDKNFSYGNILEDLDFESETKYAKYFGWNGVKWYDGCEGYEDVAAIMDGLTHLANNDFSYRYARIGESYDDYEESSFESDKEDEQDLEYPCMNRGFDDDWVIHQMKLDAGETEMEVQ